MYGLVNKAIADMIRSKFGEEAWQEVRQIAEVEDDKFLSMEGYPDDVTHRLVKASSQVLGMCPGQVMQAFGEFWVQFTASEGYGALLEMSGDNLPDFLHNLDMLHARVGISFPQLKPPSFVTYDGDHEQELTLEYHSEREGFTPMVLGLIKGVGDRFDTDVEISQTQSRENGAEHDEFMIRYKENQPCQK
jgi:hypothetical protein